jgi:hypothetical protein
LSAGDARARAAAPAVFVLALVLRLAWVATLDDGLAWPDEHEYVAIGRHLAAGDGFVASSYRSAPVLPACLAVAFRLFGDGFLAARVGQAVLGALGCLLLVRIGALLATPAVGVLAGTLLALYPQHVYLAGVFYTSALETFFCAVVVWLAARVLRTPATLGSALACGVALGLATLTRPAYLLLAPVVAAVWWTASALPRGRAAAAVAALLVGAALMLLPWSVRNRSVYGRVVLVSSGGGITLWKGNNELSDGTSDDRFLGWGRPVWLARRERLDAAARTALDAKYEAVRARVIAHEREVGDTYLAMDDVLAPVARAYVVAEPAAFVRRSLRKVVTLFSAFSPTSTQGIGAWSSLVAAATFYPVLVLALLAPVLASDRRALVLPYAVVAAMTASHAVLTSCTRFRLPIDPYLLLGASLALVGLWSRRAARVRRAPAAPPMSRVAATQS